jgi:hypothetical protein
LHSVTKQKTNLAVVQKKKKDIILNKERESEGFAPPREFNGERLILSCEWDFDLNSRAHKKLTRHNEIRINESILRAATKHRNFYNK